MPPCEGRSLNTDRKRSLRYMAVEAVSGAPRNEPAKVERPPVKAREKEPDNDRDDKRVARQEDGKGRKVDAEA